MIIYITIKSAIIIVNVVSKREDPTYEVSSFEVSTVLNMTINNHLFNMKIAGDFNAYNAIAAYTVLRVVLVMNQLKRF